MRVFMYLIIVSATLAAYVSSPDVRLAPSVVKFLPDLVSAMTMIYVIVAGTQQRFRNVSMKYWLIFSALIVTIASGAMVNQEAVGPIVNGMRYYLRAMPLFLLPAVVNFRERDLQGYLKMLLVLSLLQVPISSYQRWTNEAIGITTGDVVVGTLMESGILSLFLIAVVCELAALMLRGRLSKLWFSVLFVLLVIPMSINETKVTVFLLPIGLVSTFILAAPRGRKLLVTLQAFAFVTVAGAIFVPLYDYFNKGVAGQFRIEDFLTNPSEINKYLNKEAKIGTGQEAGRLDALEVPFKALAHDPIKLAFGLGLGNASKSSLGSQFSGKYMSLFWNFLQAASITAFMLELGVFGTGLVLLLHWMVLKDALFVARHDDGLTGILALGYVGGWLTITIGLFYTEIHTYEALSFMFWLFSGLFASRRMQLARSPTSSRSLSSFDPRKMRLEASAR